MKKMVFTVAAFAMSASVSFAGELTIHGSTTVNKNLFEPHKAQLEKETGLTLNVIANGSSRGIKGLDSGVANVGMISSGLSGVLEKVGKADKAADYVGTQVGETRVTFAVHPSNKVSELSKDQVVGILNGSIKNWSEVGGDAKPIVVVTEYKGGGVRTTVEKKLLSKAAISAASLREMPNASQITKVGAQLPNGFLTTSAKAIEGTSLKAVKSDAEIVQPLILVTKGQPSADAQKLIDSAKAILK